MLKSVFITIALLITNIPLSIADATSFAIADAASFAETPQEIIPSTPIEKTSESDFKVYGTGDVLKIDTSDIMWVSVTTDQADKLKELGIFNFAAVRKNTAFRLHIKNVRTPNIRKDLQWGGTPPLATEALDKSKDRLLGKGIFFICFGVNLRGEGECTVYIDEIDYGHELILLGYSKYNTDSGMHPLNHADYVRAEQYAKQQQKGVWQPYYDFLYRDATD